MNTSAVVDLTSLEAFAGPDLDRAVAAFGKMTPKLQAFLDNYLRKYLPKPSDREDVVLQVIEKLWVRRECVEVKSLGAWWAFVATMAKRCAFDHLRSDKQWVDVADLSEIEEKVISDAAELLEDRDQLYAAADSLWLGVDGEISDVEWTRRLLAAQLLILHETPWQEVREIVGNRQPVSRETLDEWLECESLLIALGYKHLYWSNDELTGYLLCPPGPLAPNDLDRLASAHALENCMPVAWTPDEGRVVLLHFRYGFSVDRIHALVPTMTVDEIENIMDQCSAISPFAKAALQIKEAVTKFRLATDPLRHASLWKRLVFQYHASDELPQKQILARVEPAAQFSPQKMNAGILNAWLSNGRIFTQLIEFVKEGKR